MSSIENKVIEKIKKRAAEGESKYGTTMDRDDLSMHEWLTHFQEEMMDGAIYAQKLMNQIQDESEEIIVKQNADLIFYDEEAMEDRMRAIGQNGNEGTHYDVVSGTEAAYTVYPGEAKITINKPCSSHNHWSHGFSVGQSVEVYGEKFKVIGVSDKNLSLEFDEDN